MLGTRIFAVGLLLSATLTWGQLVDQALAPNTAKAGINKSLLDEIGAGRGDVGLAFYERNYDGSMQTQFVTRPLWGIGTTAPYGHDGRGRHRVESRSCQALRARLPAVRPRQH